MKAWALFIVAMSLFGAAANGADINTQNRCDTQSVVCVADCKNYQAQTEDDPCWLITSCDSDWEKPWYSLRVKDYRQC